MMRRPLLIAAAVSPLTGCVATAPPAQAPTLQQNQQLSDRMKARSFRSYREVLLLAPRQDPQGLASRLKTEFESAGYQVRVLDSFRTLVVSQGTAFVIGADGWVLTCAHVLGDQVVATLTLNGQRLVADVVRSDKKADLALLRLRDALPAGTSVLAFRPADQPAVMGEDVVTIGYPLSQLLGNTARMSRGQLSATAGLRDNPDEVQVSAQIHPGNSGGPLLDKDGQVIGVVNKVISASAVQAATGGTLPQNINFAIKAQPILDFLRLHAPAAHAGLAFGRPAAVDVAARAIAKIQAGTVAPDAERRVQLEVIVGPLTRAATASQPAVSGVVIAAIDHETKEPLFQIFSSGAAFPTLDGPTIDAMMERLRTALRAR